MKKITLILILIISTTFLFAGSYAGDFMAIGAGVRALGMGGAYASIADDGSAIYWNVGGLSKMKESEISLMHALLYKNLATYDYFSFCQPSPNDVTIGFNWTRLSINDIPYFDEKYLVGTNIDQRILFPGLHLPGVPDDKFNSTDDLLQFGFSNHVHYDANMGWIFFKIPMDFYIGGKIKYIKRTIYKNLGTGTGFDVGFISTTPLAPIFDLDWLGDFNFGINMQDVGGTTITWDTETDHQDKILFNAKVGYSLTQPIPKYKANLLFSIDQDYVYNKIRHYGFEYQYNKKLFARLGYYDKNWTIGVSVKVRSFFIDYAFVSNELGNSNRIGLRIRY